MNDKFRPIVAFDVDGVLRVSKLDNLPDPTLFAAEITMHKDEYPDIYHGAPKWDEDGTSKRLNHFSIAGKQFLNDLIEEDKTTPVFATTWQRWANTYFGSVLEIPKLPVAVKTLFPDSLNYQHCSPSWKTNQLARQFDGRPLIWIDDNMTDRPGEDLAELRRPVDRALTCSWEVNRYTGITESDVKHIRYWLELASTPEGHVELRENRNKKMKREKLQREKWERQRNSEKKAYDIVLAKLEEIFPDQSYFTRDLANSARHQTFDEDSVSWTMKRHNIVGNADELFQKIRIPRYHVNSEQEIPFDERYNF